MDKIAVGKRRMPCCSVVGTGIQFFHAQLQVALAGFCMPGIQINGEFCKDKAVVQLCIPHRKQQVGLFLIDPQNRSAAVLWRALIHPDTLDASPIFQIVIIPIEVRGFKAVRKPGSILQGQYRISQGNCIGVEQGIAFSSPKGDVQPYPDIGRRAFYFLYLYTVILRLRLRYPIVRGICRHGEGGFKLRFQDGVRRIVQIPRRFGAVKLWNRSLHRQAFPIFCPFRQPDCPGPLIGSFSILLQKKLFVGFRLLSVYGYLGQINTHPGFLIRIPFRGIPGDLFLFPGSLQFQTQIQIGSVGIVFRKIQLLLFPCFRLCGNVQRPHRIVIGGNISASHFGPVQVPEQVSQPRQAFRQSRVYSIQAEQQ